VTCCGETEKYCSEDGYCSTIKHANNQDDYSECNNVCNECNDDCKKCCDTFFPFQPELCKAAPGAMAHFCLCGSADPFQSRGCGVDAPPMKDDESWVSPDEFDGIDAWIPRRPFVKMTCSGWEDMTEEVMTPTGHGFTVPINAGWDGGKDPVLGWDGKDPVLPPEAEKVTLDKNAETRAFVDVDPWCLPWERGHGRGPLDPQGPGFAIQLACPIACGVTPEDWLDMVAQAQYPARYYAYYYDAHHSVDDDDA
jgi:hypothetical protein